MLLVAHRLKLFGVLDNHSRTADDVATALAIARRPAEALLTTCAALRLVAVEHGQYALTHTAAAYLLEDSATYIGGYLDLVIGSYSIASFDSMEKAILTNTSQVYRGQAIFDSHKAQVELAQAFTHGMHGHRVVSAFGWPGQIDLSTARVLLDVGGGSGIHAIAATQRWARLTGMVFDLPPVCDVATNYIARYGSQLRVTTHAGDMWSEPFPSADVHLYSNMFHDWPEDKCQVLARKSFDALPCGGRILLHEMLYADDKSGPLTAAAFNGAMLLFTDGGTQRSAAELSRLLADSGFTSINVQPTCSYWSVISGHKP
jgi:hypothetical protein